MNIEKMTTTMQQALGQAQQIAMVRKHQEIDIPHLWKVFMEPNQSKYESKLISTLYRS